MKKLPKAFLLSPLALALLAVAGPASAQDAQATDPASTGRPATPQTKETVIVSGFRASVESSLAAKREENAIVDVIKSEDLAKFPDSNIAESLQRVPGVVIDRDAGEGRNITVRGLGLDFTRVRVNGIEGLATTGGTDSSGGNNRSRGFDFNVFASELFQSITVRKSSQADVDEGSLGATVDLATPRPFDLKRGFTGVASLAGRYNDLSKNTEPRLSFLVSNTFADGKMGFLISGAFGKRNLFEEGFSTVRWDNGASSGGWCAPQGMTANPANSTATTCGPAAQGVARLPNTPEAVAAYNAASDPNNFHPRLPRYGRLTHDQDRTGITGSFQWKPAQGSLLTVDMLYSKLDATRQEDFLEAISFSRSAAQGGKPQTSVISAIYDANGALQYGVYNGVDIRAESRFDKLTTTYTQPTVTWEQEFTDKLKFTAKGGRAKSKFDNPVQTTTTLDALNVNGYAIDFRGNDRLPNILYPFDPTQVGGALGIIGVPVVGSGTQPSTIPNTTSSEIRIRPQGSTNTIDVLQANLAWEMNHAVTLKGGLDYKKYDFETFEFRRVNQNDTIFAPPAGSTAASLTTSLSGFGRQFSLPGGVPTSWVIPNLNAIADAYNIYCNCLQSGPAGGPGDFTLSSTTNGNARGNNRAVQETDQGGYGMAEFWTQVWNMPLRGNFGVRYVKTKQVATGYQATGGGTQVTVEQSYNDTLPSLNLALNLDRDLILRFAAAKVMARPQLGNLSPGGSIATTGNLSITVGNPYLKPFRAKTVDGSLEWYFGKNSLLSLGLFYKDIDTYIQSLRTNVPYNQTGLPLSLLPANFTGEEVFQVTTPVNTTGGPLKGYELTYTQPFTFLPGIARNLGAILNYTHVSSKIEYLVSPTSTSTIQDDLLNLSPKSWNATLYYDDGIWGARVSGSFRDSFLQRVPGQNNNDVEGKNSTLNVDASFSYQWTPNVQFVLEGVNLTNEVNDQFISRARNSPVVYTVTGREYMFGVRVKF